MIDLQSFFSMNYGLYLVTAKHGEQAAGCVVNTLSQVTATPVQMIVAIHKDNYTTKIIEESGFFTGVTLSKDCDMNLIAKFGFASSRDFDKFKGWQVKSDENGVPYVAEQVVARFSCKVLGKLDADTHVIFLGEVTSAETLSNEEPLTYTYYHQVKKGKTPPKASSYKAEEAKKGYRCTVCGYIHESDTLPSDYICPICKKGAEFFEKI